jgi:hypothetical protein
MKNQESFSPQIENEYEVVLTEEMKRNNPNEFWEGFVKQSGKSIFNVLLEGIDPDSEALERAVSDAYKGLKPDYRKIISEEDILRQGLEYYRDHEDQKRKPYVGFGKAKGLEQKYEELCAKVEENKASERKEHIENRVKKIVEDFAEGKKDIDDANDIIEAEVKKLIQEESPTSEEVNDFRDTLWKEIYK